MLRLYIWYRPAILNSTSMTWKRLFKWNFSESMSAISYNRWMVSKAIIITIKTMLQTNNMTNWMYSCKNLIIIWLLRLFVSFQSWNWRMKKNWVRQKSFSAAFSILTEKWVFKMYLNRFRDECNKFNHFLKNFKEHKHASHFTLRTKVKF